MIWYESGGEGSRGTLLLHGLGATAAVWKSVQRLLQERGALRWLAALVPAFRADLTARRA